MSRTLILMRHGEAADPAGAPDHERPLTRRGTEQAVSAGAWLGEHLPPIRAVLCSTALRTRRTLDAVSHGAGWAAAPPDGAATGATTAAAATDPTRTYARAIYEAAPEDVLGEIALTEPGASTLLVIGHFPGLPQTALALDPAGRHSAEVRRGLPAAGCIVLRTDEAWDALVDAAAPAATIRRVRTP